MNWKVFFILNFIFLFQISSTPAQCYFQGCSGLYADVDIINYPKLIQSDFSFDLQIKLPPCLPEYSGRIAVIKLGSNTFPERVLDTVNGVLSPAGTTFFESILFPGEYKKEGLKAGDSLLYVFTIKLLDNENCPEEADNYTDPSPRFIAVYACETTTSNFSVTNCESYNWNDSVYNMSGEFIQTFTALNGCDSIVTLNLLIDSPDTSVTVFLTMEEDVMLQSNATGVNYQWINCSTLDSVPDATSQNFMAEEIGSYAVIVSNNNCVDTSGCYTISSIGITENKEDYFILYPNPFSNSITINTGKMNMEQVQIIDLMGNSVLTANVNASEVLMDLSSLPKGAFFIRIETGQKRLTKKIIRL
jgi:hypothetical protein